MARVWWVCLVLGWAGQWAGLLAFPRQVTIAAIFDQGGDRTHELAFRHAVRGINKNR